MNEGPAKHWYHNTWLIVAAGFGVLILAGLAIFLGLTGWYWWQIKQGKGAELLAGLPKNFSAAKVSASFAPAAINRQELEPLTAPYRGRPDAGLVVVEWVDFKCPNCGLAHPIMKKVMEEYGYKIKLVIRHFPVESTHPGATEIAQLTWCADKQGRFWPAHDALLENQNQLTAPLSAETFKWLADLTGLNQAELEACTKSQAAVQQIRKEYFDGIRFGVRGTPTFFINGSKVEGVVPLDKWMAYLKSAK